MCVCVQTFVKQVSRLPRFHSPFNALVSPIIIIISEEKSIARLIEITRQDSGHRFTWETSSSSYSSLLVTSEKAKFLPSSIKLFSSPLGFPSLKRVSRDAFFRREENIQRFSPSFSANRYAFPKLKRALIVLHDVNEYDIEPTLDDPLQRALRYTIKYVRIDRNLLR